MKMKISMVEVGRGSLALCMVDRGWVISMKREETPVLLEMN